MPILRTITSGAATVTGAGSSPYLIGTTRIQPTTAFRAQRVVARLGDQLLDSNGFDHSIFKVLYLCPRLDPKEPEEVKWHYVYAMSLTKGITKLFASFKECNFFRCQSFPGQEQMKWSCSLIKTIDGHVEWLRNLGVDMKKVGTP